MALPTRTGLSLQPGDIVWNRVGTPLRVTSQPDPKQGGKVHVDEDFDSVRQVAQISIQNGLGNQRERYQSDLDEVSSTDDIRDSIDALFEKVRTLQASGQNPKLLRYLDSELKYRMLQSGYHPFDYSQSPETLEF